MRKHGYCSVLLGSQSRHCVWHAQYGHAWHQSPAACAAPFAPGRGTDLVDTAHTDALETTSRTIAAQGHGPYHCRERPTNMTTNSTLRYTQGKLVAIHMTKPGDVVYLFPEHREYLPRGFAIILDTTAHQAASAGGIVHDFPDSDRCVERSSVRKMAECVGMTHKTLREAVRAAKEGSLSLFPATSAQVSEPAELPPWMAE
jgi:hypothetical protein